MKNCAWRLGAKYGVAYMEDNGLATELLEMEGISSKPSDAAMATYYSPKGKAFAWQVKFDLDRWDRVARKLGMPVEERNAVVQPKKKAAAPAGKTQAKGSTKPSSTTSVKASSKTPRKAAVKAATEPSSKPSSKPSTKTSTKAATKAVAKAPAKAAAKVVSKTAPKVMTKTAAKDQSRPTAGTSAKAPAKSVAGFAGAPKRSRQR